LTCPLFHAVLLLGAITLPLSGSVSAQAGKTQLATDRLAFRVRVYNDERVPEGDLSAALKIADSVLQRLDLQATWQDCIVGNPSRDSSGCDLHPARIDLALYLEARLEAHAPNVDKNGLGYSIIPDNGESATMAYVCFSRVKTLRSLFSWEELLGLAIAHELGHLLLGTNLHSNTGLMRANWPRKDLESRDWEKFEFTREQARQIRTAILVRMASRSK
jgi:hypothetical protein